MPVSPVVVFCEVILNSIIDGRADIVWSDIVYGTDPQGQTYVLGVKGLSADTHQLTDDLDLGSPIFEGNAVTTTYGSRRCICISMAV